MNDIKYELLQNWYEEKKNTEESILILNLRKENMTAPWDVRIDRFSPLGNPFVITNFTSRSKVCRLYDDWFIEKVNSKNKRVMQELHKLLSLYIYHGILRLFCWCAPKQCHGETIKRWLVSEIVGPKP